MNQYFPPYRSSRNNIKVELDLSSYAAKTDLKNVTHVGVSSFASKTNLSNLKAEVDKLDIDKVLLVLNDLTQLSNVVKNGVTKKITSSVNKTDTARFVLETTYDTHKSDLEKKISDADKKKFDTSGIVKKKDFDSNITEIEGKILSFSGLATNSTLTAVENKIPNISN